MAKVAAKLAVGYTLDELMNDITCCSTSASFQPSIDYVVTRSCALLREVCWCESLSDHADELCWFSDGHWPHAPGVPAKALRGLESARPASTRWFAFTA
ncbi:hypothetical protein ACNKHQ_00175 [Shigella flexneri]